MLRLFHYDIWSKTNNCLLKKTEKRTKIRTRFLIQAFVFPQQRFENYVLLAYFLSYRYLVSIFRLATVTMRQSMSSCICVLSLVTQQLLCLPQQRKRSFFYAPQQRQLGIDYWGQLKCQSIEHIEFDKCANFQHPRLLGGRYIDVLVLGPIYGACTAYTPGGEATGCYV